MTKFSELQALYDRVKTNPPRLGEFVTALFLKDTFSDQSTFEQFIRFCFSNKEIRERYADKIVDRLERLPENIDEERLRQFLMQFLREVAPGTDCSNFYYTINYRYKERETGFLLSKQEVAAVCEYRLARYCEENDDVAEAFGLLYLCWDHVDRENRVHLTRGALQVIREFIMKVPYDYLRFLVRPKYNPGVSCGGPEHVEYVFEPFTEAIFGVPRGFGSPDSIGAATGVPRFPRDDNKS